MHLSSGLWAAALLCCLRSVPATPLKSINYFFLRTCNYRCGFCFHTASSKQMLPLDTACAMMKALREAGACKINFAGGEPFLQAEHLGAMVRYCKETLAFPSVSIISNGVYVSADWMERYGAYLDMLGVSCDASDGAINRAIGRSSPGSGEHVTHVRRSAALCHRHGVLFKMNTVVNAFNHAHDMSALVNEVRPSRWKVFQVLPLEGENVGDGAIRQVGPFLITPPQFDAFVARHSARIHDPSILIREDNAVMRDSYILIDEEGRFLDSSLGKKTPTQSILDVGVDAALHQLLSSAGGGFDADSFEARDGVFQWTKPPAKPPAL